MREVYEFRVAEEYANILFRPEEGKRSGMSVRKVEIDKEDSRFVKIGELQQKIKARDGKPFFFGWNIERQYTREELQKAELLYVNSSTTVEPSGEECGTLYDDAFACIHCGVGREQMTALKLDLQKIPTSVDIASTLGNEWIISQRLAELLIDSKVTGFELQHIQHKTFAGDEIIDLDSIPSGREILKHAEKDGASHPTWRFWVWLNRSEQEKLLIRARQENESLLHRKKSEQNIYYPRWYQLLINSQPIPIASPPSKFGINPFDDDAKDKFRCPQGHVLGLNLLSEVWIQRKDWDGSDVVATRESVGILQGLLVPTPLILISQRLWRLLEENEVSGYSVELARFI